MFIESIATGNGIPRGRRLWSDADVQKRRREYTLMVTGASGYIDSPLFPSKPGTFYSSFSPFLTFYLGDSTNHSGNIQAEFVEPPETVTPESLVGVRIWCCLHDGTCHKATIMTCRSNRNRFMLSWEALAATSVETLLPLGDETSIKFQIAREDLRKVYDVIYQENAGFRRTVR